MVDEYRMIIENCDYSADDQLFDYLDNGITDPDLAEDYFSAMSCVSVLQTNDWGIFNIITDEMASYSQGKSIEEIAESLQSRLNLYIDENYS